MLVMGRFVYTQFVILRDLNESIKTCDFAMGSLDNGLLLPVQPNDTIIHSFIDYCVDPRVDSITIKGIQVIDQ